MRFLRASLTCVLLGFVTTAVIGCSAPSEPTQSTSTVQTAPSEQAVASTETIKFKRDDGAEAFSFKAMPDGAKLVDAADKELARFNVDTQQKIKIKNAADQVLGYVVPEAGYWKIENAEQSQELYVLRQQDDGDFKLETGNNQPIYRIKKRDYGFEIETPQKQSLYKVKVKEGKTSLRNAQDQTILSTRSAVRPEAIAAFGFDKLSREQQAALAYAVNRSGEQ